MFALRSCQMYACDANRGSYCLWDNLPMVWLPDMTRCGARCYRTAWKQICATADERSPRWSEVERCVQVGRCPAFLLRKRGICRPQCVKHHWVSKQRTVRLHASAVNAEVVPSTVHTAYVHSTSILVRSVWAGGLIESDGRGFALRRLEFGCRGCRPLGKASARAIRIALPRQSWNCMSCSRHIERAKRC